MALPLDRDASDVQGDDASYVRGKGRPMKLRSASGTGTFQCDSELSCASPQNLISNLEVLDVGSFVHFAPLLEACQDYARLSGCRFYSLSSEALSLEPFYGEVDLTPSTIGDRSVEGLGPRLFAEYQAVPAVLDFTRRLQSGEVDLLSDLSSAKDVMMKEGVRNSLRGTCKQLGLWPPRPAPPGVDINDCFYYDSQADLPVVAQRLYNDQKRRARMRKKNGGVDLERRLACTASFLVDFAHEAGISTPDTNSKHTALLHDLTASASAWERKGKSRKQYELEENIYDVVTTDITEAVDLVRLEVRTWLSRAMRST